MNTLLLVLSVFAAAHCAPQLPWPTLVLKDSSTARLVALRAGPGGPGGGDVYYVPVSARAAPDLLVPVARQDTSRGLPNAVQDTPEVAAAKVEFQRAYESAAVAAALAPERRRRDVETPAQRDQRQLLLVSDWSAPFFGGPHPLYPHFY